MKQCARCREWKPHAAFAYRSRSRDRLQPYCRLCNHLFHLAHYAGNRAAMQSMLDERREWQRAINRRLVGKYLRDHPCVDCGITDPIVLEFDHVRGTKVKSVGAMVLAPVATETLRREIDKCVVRCANCHRRRTARTWPYSLRLPSGQETNGAPSERRWSTAVIVAQLVRAPDCGSGGRGFKSPQSPHAPVAQSVEQWPFKPFVAGSSPAGRTKVPLGRRDVLTGRRRAGTLSIVAPLAQW
jgi:hypothetical protein